MITDEILLENGYKKCKDNLYNADCLFQKRIKNEKGQTKYFIDIYKYAFKVNDYKPDYEVRLITEKEKYALNILLYATKNEMTLEEIEKEVYAIWYGLDCKYYDCEAE